MKAPFQFVLMAMLIAVAYGVAHDLVTAHVAVEYFTVHHPRVVPWTSPVAMALVWGFLATFWVGLGAGVLIAAANQFGSWKRLDWNLLVRRFAWSTACLWASAMVVLMGIFAIAGRIPEAQRRTNFDSDRRLMAVAITHAYSYAAAATFGAGFAVWVLIGRYRASRAAD